MTNLAGDWNSFKHALSPIFGISQDAFHVIVGVLVQIALATIIRRSLAHPIPWVGVAALEALNEYSDLRLENWPDRSVQLGESWKDAAITLFLPTLLFLLARYWPHRLTGQRA